MIFPTHIGKVQTLAIASAVLGVTLHAIPAWATVSPTNLDFADVDFGGQSPAKYVQITAPKGAAFKSIFGLSQFQILAGGCIPFKSDKCTVTVVADNTLDRVGAFGQHGGYLLVTYTSGTTDYIGVNANFLPPPLHLQSPSADANYPYLASKLNATDTILFQAEGSASIAVVWSVDIKYRTSAGKCKKCKFTQTFNSFSTQEIPQIYTSVGGQATATAQQIVAGVVPRSVNFTVTGVDIPATMVTNELVSRYGGKRLLTGIAKLESGYHQFAKRTLFGQSALWPNESGEDGGSHIGLMQMPVAMDVAWDWRTNIGKAAILFGTKLDTAKTFEGNIRRRHPGLGVLDAEDEENMALVLYGPYASADLDKQYYAPTCKGGTVSGSECQGGTWEWEVNIEGNGEGVAYAASVRDRIVK